MKRIIGETKLVMRDLKLMSTDLQSHEIPPEIKEMEWSLLVDGLVERPRRLTKPKLLEMNHRTATGDFTCVEGWTARDLSWSGVPVRDVLDLAIPQSDASFGLVYGRDSGYSCGFRLTHLRDAILATELNGNPLPTEHGGPARLIPANPESDCWESVKWVSRIELLGQQPETADAAERIARSRLD